MVKQKIKETNLDRYGVENFFELVNKNPEQFPKNKPNKPTQEEIYRPLYGDKWKTYLRYGVTTEEELAEVKQKNIEKRKLKVLDTIRNRYGVDNISQLDDVKEKKKTSSLEKFGVEYVFQSANIVEKIKVTNRQRYGVDNVFQSDEIKEKIKATNVEIYGDTCARRNEIINDKIKATNLEKYGFECPTKNEEVKQKTVDTNRQRYGTDYHTQTQDFIENIKESSFRKYGVDHHTKRDSTRNLLSRNVRVRYYDAFVFALKMKDLVLLMSKENYHDSKTGDAAKYECTSCGKIFESVIDHQQRISCECSKQRSSYENIIVDWLIGLGITNIETNKRFYYDGLRRFDLDIFLPDYNLGIEFHGLYYHRFTEDDADRGQMDKQHHKKQYMFFREKNIKLIQIFENEFITKELVVKSIITNHLKLNNKIPGRKCVVREIDSKVFGEFLDSNHIQGKTPSKYKIGLFHGEDLVSVMGIGESRFNKNYNYELVRFCNRIGHNVIGGFNKLLSFFESNVAEKSEKIVSYVDVRYFDGAAYTNWTFVDHTQPNYFYFKSSTMKRMMLESRLKYQKHKLIDLLEKFDDSMTEWENMKNNGFHKIYDAGNKIFTKTI
jgi:hypothetical protein